MQLPLDKSTYILKFKPGIYKKAQAVFGKDKVKVIQEYDGRYVEVIRTELNLCIVVDEARGENKDKPRLAREVPYDSLLILAPKWFVDMFYDIDLQDIHSIRRDITFTQFYNGPSQWP